MEGTINNSSINHAHTKKSILKNNYLLNIVIFALSVLLGLFVFGKGHYLISGNQPATDDVSINSIKSKNQQFESAEINKELRSPADNKKLEYSSQLSIGLYLGGIPVDIFFEQYGNASEGRIVVYHAWNKVTNRNEGAFVVSEEGGGPCLTDLIPTAKDGGMRFVTEYLCGDSQRLKITSFSFKPTSSIREINVENLNEFNLNDYFSTVYLKSFIKIIGWQDFDNLLVNQITYSGIGSSQEKQELYLFNIDTKEKQLIHTIE